ncbi:hypothetical protein ECH_0569 [Ehrlichia chaffeensis str. Arkansas]|uniref:Uncharacterized protein n=1 Tax=Ehrlichia chaffeensis (strain ATCC CRL-10679 / Arkansas) TaxID=205920 RepID=Q2GGQ2_EHRCR|nr:hypothetical protein ECH_0569 [Ehrlichia chaffeensis str. Arkansas]
MKVILYYVNFKIAHLILMIINMCTFMIHTFYYIFNVNNKYLVFKFILTLKGDIY